MSSPAGTTSGVKATVRSGPSKLRITSAPSIVYPSEREFRVIGVLNALDEPDRVPRIALAPFQRDLARVQGEPRIGLVRRVELIEARLPLVAARFPTALEIRPEIQARIAVAELAGGLEGEGGLVELLARIIVEVDQVDRAVLVELGVLLLEFDVAAELDGLLLERRYVERIGFRGPRDRCLREQQRGGRVRGVQPHLRSSSARDRLLSVNTSSGSVRGLMLA